MDSRISFFIMLAGCVALVSGVAWLYNRYRAWSDSYERTANVGELYHEMQRKNIGESKYLHNLTEGEIREINTQLGSGYNLKVDYSKETKILTITKLAKPKKDRSGLTDKLERSVF